MSHQDRKSTIVVNHQVLKQVVDWLLPPALFAGWQAPKNTRWCARMLAVAALLWGAGAAENLTERFKLARRIVGKIFRGRQPAGGTYQGFIKALRKQSGLLRDRITRHIRQQMQETLPDHGKVGGYTVFAADGSRVELARTKSLEEAFSPQAAQRRQRKQRAGRRSAKGTLAANRAKESAAKKATSPQLWLTLLWHVGMRLPWAWQSGPSDSSERGHVEAMLAELPKNSLFALDAGFVGYDFWNTVLNAGHQLLVRVGANVKLLTQLGYARQTGQTVYLWPAAAARRKQQPLVLRLIVIHNGRHPAYLVTNLPKSKLSDQQAGQIYAQRWGIELYFRTLKQTFGCCKLRSRRAENATLELDWSMLALWCTCLLGQRELASTGKPPAVLSAAKAIAALRTTITHYRVRPESREESLWQKLRVAQLDNYQRAGSKSSRSYPRKKRRKAIGAPRLIRASQQQITAAQQLKHNHTPFRLSA